jgi:hypothetical protein
VDPVHVFALRDAQGHMVEAGALAVKRHRRIADVDLQVIDLGLHQNFSHFTLFRSMPFWTSTSRTLLMVSPPPQT